MVAAAMDYEFEFEDIPSSIVPLGTSAVPMAGEYSWARSLETSSGVQRHTLVSNMKARVDLGYEDAVEPIAWIGRTVEYWLANPPRVDGQAGRFMPAEFDYWAEDALLAYWRQVRSAAGNYGKPLLKSHPYDHPASGKVAAPINGAKPAAYPTR